MATFSFCIEAVSEIHPETSAHQPLPISPPFSLALSVRASSRLRAQRWQCSYRIRNQSRIMGRTTRTYQDSVPQGGMEETTRIPVSLAELPDNNAAFFTSVGRVELWAQRSLRRVARVNHILCRRHIGGLSGQLVINSHGVAQGCIKIW